MQSAQIELQNIAGEVERITDEINYDPRRIEEHVEGHVEVEIRQAGAPVHQRLDFLDPIANSGAVGFVAKSELTAAAIRLGVAASRSVPYFRSNSAAFRLFTL